MMAIAMRTNLILAVLLAVLAPLSLLAGRVWIDPQDLAAGGAHKLRLGASEPTVVVTGVELAPYLQLQMSLRLAGFDVSFQVLNG